MRSASTAGQTPLRGCGRSSKFRNLGRALVHADATGGRDRPHSFFSAALGVCLVAALLTGCSVVPDYHPAPPLAGAPHPTQFANATNAVSWKAAVPSAHLTRDGWWAMFGDPAINALVTNANAASPTLAAASARFRQARALVDVARAGYFPNVTGGAAMSRERTSKNQFDRGTAAGVSHTFTTYSIPLEAGWAADLWGRVRRQVEAARAQLDAQSADLESVRLALQAEVVADYFSLRALDAELDILRQSQTAFGRALELTRNRRTGGIATDLDVAQAETQLRGVEAQLPAVELQRTRLLHALATLVGQSASTFELPPAKPVATGIACLPAGLPSELLERRPDVAAAERRMAEANANVGVAHAAFYPQLRLNGLAGFKSVDAATLFDWPSRFWAVGPSLELPLFQGSRNRARLAASQAAYDETVARYRQTVLGAFQEVEDQLAAQRLLAAEAEAESAALAASRRVLVIAENRYRAGLVTYLEVVTAQNNALTHERTMVRLQAQRQLASVALIKALGGGWEPLPR